MRDELVRTIRERTGLDEGMAEQVVTVVVDYLRTQLPPEIAPMLAMVLGGDAAGPEGGAPATGESGAPAIPDVGGLLGGMFGPRGS